MKPNITMAEIDWDAYEKAVVQNQNNKPKSGCLGVVVILVSALLLLL